MEITQNSPRMARLYRLSGNEPPVRACESRASENRHGICRFASGQQGTGRVAKEESHERLARIRGCGIGGGPYHDAPRPTSDGPVTRGESRWTTAGTTRGS